MRIVADANITGVKTLFSALGDVEELQGRAIDNTALRDADILLVRSVTPVDAALLDGTAVRFVGSATSGIDHIDRQLLEERGIGFAYAPGSNATAVLEYVISALAGCDDVLERLCASGRVGIIGYGVIGKRLRQRLLALGIDCIAYDPWLEQSAYPELVALEEVLAADVISVHAELTHRQPWPSHHLLDARALAAIPATSLLINAGRGSIVDGKALLRRLSAPPVFSAVLDVWEHEPEVDTRLLSLCRFGTPHIAGYSYDGKLLATRMLLRAVCELPGLAVAPPALSSLAQQDEPVAALEIPGDLAGAALIRWLQRQSYDIAADDARMRKELALGFDRLRSTYPLRRELGAYRVANFRSLAAGAQQVCTALGCRVE